MNSILKITLTALSVGVGASLIGCAADDYGVEPIRYARSGDCAKEGPRKPIVQDSGAGVTFNLTNDTRWCNPRGKSLNPADDPVFNKRNGGE